MPYLRSDHRRSHGFTLIEVLVSIGIMAILLALALPALSRARGAGREVVTLSNLHGLGTTFEHYLQSYDEVYPYAPEGTWFVVSPPDSGEREMVRGSYWDLTSYWTALMHDIAPWREHFATWIGPGGVEDQDRPWRRESEVGRPSYYLSHTFFARPELWAPAERDDPRFYRPVRGAEVMYPAGKVMLWDVDMLHVAGNPRADLDLRPLLFADGHAAVRRLSEAAQPPEIPFKPGTRPVQDTPDGVHGRDY